MKIQKQVSLQLSESLVSSERRELGVTPDLGLCQRALWEIFFHVL